MSSSASALSKAIIPATLVYLVMLFVGFFPQRWLTSTFSLPVNGTYLFKTRPIEVFALVPPDGHELFNKTWYSFTVTSNMGLFANCKDSIGDISGNYLTDYSCDSDGAAVWQELAFCAEVGALLLGTVCLAMTCMGSYNHRFQDHVQFRFAIVIINFVTGFLALSAVIMYSTNRRFQVKPPLPTMITFDVGWALHLTLAAVGVSGLVFMFNTYLITLMGRKVNVEEGKENSAFGDSYSMKHMTNGGIVARF